MASLLELRLTAKHKKILIGVVTAALLWFSLWIFAEMIDDAPKGEFSGWDESLIHLLRGKPDAPQSAAVVVTAARLITFLGGTLMLTLLSVGTVIWLVLKQRWRAALVTGVTIASAQSFTFFLKNHFVRGRPTLVDHLVAVSSWSFPSGHASMSSVVYVMLGVLIATGLIRRWQQFAIVAGAFLLSFLIGLSRIYLGVHYPTDVLAGWSGGLALAIVGSTILIWWDRPTVMQPRQTTDFGKGRQP